VTNLPLSAKPSTFFDGLEDRPYRIGEIADLLGVSLRTLRFYEEKGLIVPQRTLGAHRHYGKADISRLEFILTCRHIGLTVEATRAILNEIDTEPRSRAPLLAKLKKRLADIEADRKTLEEQEGMIARWLTDLEQEG
jgi:DNA-binding transcriptional MerR regulator